MEKVVKLKNELIHLSTLCSGLYQSTIKDGREYIISLTLKANQSTILSHSSQTE